MIRIKPVLRASQTTVSTTALVSSETEKDRKLTASLEFLLGKVLSQRIGSPELTARLDPTNTIDQRGGVSNLLARNNFVVRINGTSITDSFENLTAGAIISKDREICDSLLNISKLNAEALAENNIQKTAADSLKIISDLAFSGKFSVNELTERLNQSNTVDNRGTVSNLLARNSLIVRVNGTSITDRYENLLAGNITGGNADLSSSLLGIATSNENARIRRNSSNSELAALNNITSIVTDRNVSFQELAARLDPTNTVDDRGSLSSLLGRNQLFIRIGGSAITDSVQNLKDGISVAQLGVANELLELHKVIKGKTYGDGISNATTNYLKDPNPANLEVLKQLFLAEGKADDGKVVIGNADAINDLKRRKQFEITFLNSFPTEGTSKLVQIIELHELITAEDNQVRTEFLSYVGAKRRSICITAAVNNFSNGYDKVLEELRPILTSRFELDKKAGTAVLELFCRNELAQLTLAGNDLINKSQPEDVDKFMSAYPIRATVGSADYLAAFEKLRGELAVTGKFVTQFKRLRECQAVRNLLVEGQPDYPAIKNRIMALNFSLEDDGGAVKILYSEARTSSSVKDPTAFRELFQNELAEMRKAETARLYILPELGRNKKAAYAMAKKFKDIFNPLLQVLRRDPKSKQEMAKYLPALNGDKTVRLPKSQFEIDIKELSKQRPLSEIEESYLQSVELLSKLNPGINCNALRLSQMKAAEYLRAHFANRTKKTWEGLSDGDYVPVVLIGSGVHGIASMGEITRLNPELANDILVIDQEDLPGGPFAVPNGPSWELNSANSRGDENYILPDLPADELKTVRAYGSPTRFLPGERIDGNPRSRGSINQVVDYMPPPDTLSGFRYPTNFEFALMAQAQAALVTNKIVLNTELIKEEKNLDPEKKGDKIVTLKLTKKDGTTEIKRIYTDGIIAASGLGDANYGFKVEGS